MAICAESGDVQEQTVLSWKERLPAILWGCKKEDIFNIDKTGCFWQVLHDRAFAKKGKKCKGGKRSEYRITVALITNAVGDKQKATVIGKSQNPHCF